MYLSSRRLPELACIQKINPLLSLTTTIKVIFSGLIFHTQSMYYMHCESYTRKVADFRNKTRPVRVPLVKKFSLILAKTALWDLPNQKVSFELPFEFLVSLQLIVVLPSERLVLVIQKVNKAATIYNFH